MSSTVWKLSEPSPSGRLWRLPCISNAKRVAGETRQGLSAQILLGLSVSVLPRRAQGCILWDEGVL